MPDLGVRAAAIAAAGSAVALHARDRSASAAELAALADRFVALTRPAESATIVNGRPDTAAAVGAHGVQLAAGDLAPRDARTLLTGWIGRSVHSREEAEAAADEGADYLVLGTIHPSESHPGRAPLGERAIRDVARLGLPVIAIGGMTPARARAARDAGAWGVAGVRSLWYSADPARAALEFLSVWDDD